MKRILVSLTLVFLFGFGGVAYAGTRSNCGCGLGTMLWDHKNGLVFQLMAATTNAFMLNQAFGISSGTLGCEMADYYFVQKKINQFVADNMDTIAIDIAAGQGETLEAISELTEIPVPQRPSFYASLKNNFGWIYDSEEITHLTVTSKLAFLIDQL